MADDLQRNPLSDRRFFARLRDEVRRELGRAARPVRGLLAAMSGVGAQAMFRAGEAGVDVEVAQHFGFASVAPPGTEVVAVPVGGSSAHLVIVGELDRVARPAAGLLAGEAALYSLGGAQVTATLTGQVLLNGPGAPVARVGDTVQVVLDTAAITALAAQMVAAGLVAPGSGSGATPPGVAANGSVTSGSTSVLAG